MCASSGDDQALDFCSATEALFPGPLIDLEAGLKSPELAIALPKISDAGAAGSYGLFEYSFHGPVQSGDSEGAQALGGLGWVYAGGEEDLVGVDISEADNNGLIEEESFDHSPSAQKLFEMGQTDAERFWAELCHCGLGEEAGFGGIQLESAEAADVAEVKDLIALGEFEAKVGVTVGAVTGAGPTELAGHSQVNG